MNDESNQNEGVSSVQAYPGNSAAVPVPSVEPPMPAASPVLRPTVEVHAPEAQPAAGTVGRQATALETPAEAADSDNIEREWVVRAKQVVQETRQDPYKQVQEINRIKADYMKKRYDKDIKLADA